MKTYRIEFVDNTGSRAIDAIAATVRGSWDARSCSSDLEGVDFGRVTVDDENAEYLEEILSADENVIGYTARWTERSGPAGRAKGQKRGDGTMRITLQSQLDRVAWFSPDDPYLEQEVRDFWANPGVCTHPVFTRPEGADEYECLFCGALFMAQSVSE